MGHRGPSPATGELPQGHARHLQNRDPPRERLADAPHEVEGLGAGQHDAPHLGGLIDEELDLLKQPGNPLNLVNGHGKSVGVEEERRVLPGEHPGPGVIERHVAEISWQQVLQHRGLADLTRPGHQHHLELSHEGQQRCLGLAMPVHEPSPTAR